MARMKLTTKKHVHTLPCRNVVPMEFHSNGQNASYCHTPFRDSGNEASIRVPRMFHSHILQQYDKQIPCSGIQGLKKITE
jgi:hypothetical protein